MARFVHDEERSSPLAGTDNGGENIIGANSRPHSSTSAELEGGMSALTIQPQIVQPPVPIRTKEARCVFMEIPNMIHIYYNMIYCASIYICCFNRLGIRAKGYIRLFPINRQKQARTSCVN